MVLVQTCAFYYSKICFKIILPYNRIPRKSYTPAGILQKVFQAFLILLIHSAELNLLCLMQIVSQFLSFNTGDHAVCCIIYFCATNML